MSSADDVDTGLRELRILLESNATQNGPETNRLIADRVFASPIAMPFVLNAIAQKCRSHRPPIVPDEYATVVYEAWIAPEFRWGPYSHFSDEKLLRFLFRIARRTTAGCLRSKRPNEISLDANRVDCAVEDQRNDDDDLRNDLYMHIIRADVERRVRLVLLTQLETADLQETASRLNISLSTAERYVRAGIPILNQWLKDH